MDINRIKKIIDELDTYIDNKIAKIKVIYNFDDDAKPEDYFFISNTDGYLKLASELLKGSIAPTKGEEYVKLSNSLDIETDSLRDEDSEIKISKFFKGHDIKKLAERVDDEIPNEGGMSMLVFIIVAVLLIGSTSTIGIVSIIRWLISA